MLNTLGIVYLVAGAACVAYYFLIGFYSRFGLSIQWVWLALGAWFSARRERLPAAPVLWGGLALSLGALIAEGAKLHSLEVLRHDSMYIALLPCMFFLFALLLARSGERRGAWARRGRGAPGRAPPCRG